MLKEQTTDPFRLPFGFPLPLRPRATAGDTSSPSPAKGEGLNTAHVVMLLRARPAEDPSGAPAGSAVRRGGLGQAQRPVAVGVELGEFTVDVDRVGAVEVDVLVVGRPDVRQDLVVDLPVVAA